MTTETDTVGLLKLSTDGSTSLQTVTSSNFVQQDAEDSAGNLTEQDSGSASDLDRAIPDGQGGMLIAWDQTAIAPQETAVRMITDTSSGASFPIPMDSDPQQLIVGENGTAFVSNTTGSVSFDMNSGTVNWTYHPPSGYQVSMIASISGNGLAAQLNATSGISATLVRLDPTGTATVDPWTAAGIENYGGSQWLAISNGALSAISAAPVELSAASWYAADGNGGNAAIQNISVTNFSQSGANQTTISNVLQKIQTALPNYATCNNWLQGSGKNQGTSGLSEIQQLLQFNAFGHGTVHLGSAIDYDTWAFSGVINPDKSHISGVPDGIAMTVHDLAGFFNTNYPNSAPYNGAAYLLGPRQYPGDSLRAQGATVIHEVAHQITVAGFQPDFGNDKAEKANNKAVDANCRQLIEGVR